MSFTQIAQAPQIEYPIDVSFPGMYDSGGGSAQGVLPNAESCLAKPPMNRGGQPNPEEITYGTVGGGGVNQTFERAGSIHCVHNDTTAGAALTVFGHPYAQPFFDVSSFNPGIEIDEINTVWWLRLLLRWTPGVGDFTDDLTGFYIGAYNGTTVTVGNMLSGVDPSMICGIVGRLDGAVQQYRYRAWDDAAVVLDTVDLVSADTGIWNQFDFVITGASLSRPNALLQVFLNNTQTPVVTRFFDGVTLLRPQDFPDVNFGLFFGLADESGAVTRAQIYRWRLRAGAFLPDGSPVRLT